MYLTYSTALPHTIYLKKCRIFFLRNAFFASKIFTALWLPLPSKGQIISEAIFLVLNSSKKQTICFQNFAPATRTEVFCSFFWKNRKQEKKSSDINWPLQVPKPLGWSKLFEPDQKMISIYTNSLVNATFGSWKKSC